MQLKQLTPLFAQTRQIRTGIEQLIRKVKTCRSRPLTIQTEQSLKQHGNTQARQRCGACRVWA